MITSGTRASFFICQAWYGEYRRKSIIIAARMAELFITLFATLSETWKTPDLVASAKVPEPFVWSFSMANRTFGNCPGLAL